MEYKIYSQAGILKTSFDPGTSTHLHEAQVDNVLNLSFTLNEYVSLDVNDYIDINADRFTLLESYKPVVKNTKQYEYSVKFYGAESIAKKAQFVDENYEPITAYYDTPASQLQFIVNCINRVIGSNRYSVGAVVSSVAISVDYASGANCFAALGVLAEAAGTEWWLDGTSFNLTKCEHGETVTLGYGAGLLSLDKEINSDSSFFTRLIPLGSTKNIVKSTYGYSRLQLPGGIKYVDQNVSDYGIVEKVVEDAFADIYPRFTGHVGLVRMETKTIESIERTVYYFTDTTMGFNPNDYAVVGLVKHVVFKSGDLNGRDFEANWYPSTGEWELINQYPDENTQVPGNNVIPRAGDTYTVYNIEMPAIYRTNAEAEYLAAVQAYLAKYAIDFSIYKAPTDHVYLEDNNITLTLGQRVKLISDKYFTSGSRDSRITKITRKLSDLNQMDIEVSNVISKGSYSQLQDDLSNLKTAVKEQLSTEILQIIKSFSVGDLTDDNVLSSLRVLKEIKNRALSKNEADTAKKLITLEDGAKTKYLESLFFTSGRLGSGFKIYVDESGKTHAEFDKVLVRDEFVANKMTIADVTSVGGQILITVANMNCYKVEEFADIYRCYFKTDNNTIPNRFIVGDQAICQTFNSTGQKYYWRLVTAIGSDYIDLSKTDCEGTSIPALGDEIIQCGNRTDTSRQNAILISAYGNGPAIKQYAGIKSYSFVDCEKTVISDKYNKFTGDFYLETGESIATLLKIQEGLIYSEISSIRKEVAAKDNLLKNASFSADTLYWLAINEIKIFTVNGKLLSFNHNFYGNKNRTLKVVQDGSRLTIRVKNIGIKQLNENISKPSKVVLADGTTDNPNFYISFQYRCTLAGTLKIGFSGTPLYFEQQLAVTEDYQYLELSGKWDLNGDFTLSFDGDMFLYDLSLRNDKLQDFALLTSSKFTQTDASISAIVQQINTINNTIANAGWLTESDKVKIWAMLTFGETNTTLESLFEVTANGIFLKSNHIDLTGKVSFNSLSTDFQSTYANDISNAQLAAKNGIAQQLGFTNYAQLVENAIVGKTLILGGYINSELIDVATLLAGKIVAMQGTFNGSISTPFQEKNYYENESIDLETYSCISAEAYVGYPITLTLPTDLKYNGREIYIYNKGLTSNSLPIDIKLSSGGTTSTISLHTLAMFKAILANGAIGWIRVI